MGSEMCIRDSFEDAKETVISPLLTMVDEVKESLDKRLNASPANKIMILVYSEETFNSLLGGAFRRIEGFFSFEDAKIRLAVKSRSLQDVRFLKSTICQEYIHFLIHYISQGRLRIRWLHEGIASYFEKAETGFDPFADIDQAATRVPVAVSYTHLRAHETVLDLVCRLLLEKKNKKNKNNTNTVKLPATSPT